MTAYQTDQVVNPENFDCPACGIRVQSFIVVIHEYPTHLVGPHARRKPMPQVQSAILSPCDHEVTGIGYTFRAGTTTWHATPV